MHFINTVERDNGHEVVVKGDTVSVLLLDTDDFVLVKEYRAGPNTDVLSVVSGYVEPGETDKEAAIRECIEETGIKPNTLVDCGRFWKSPGWTDERVHMFIGLHLERVGEPEDSIEVVRIKTFKDDPGAIHDQTFITLLLMAQQMYASTSAAQLVRTGDNG